MEPARPLRELFSELVGDADGSGADPARMLGDAGHADLPDGLVAEALASYADTAAAEVAEHLAPFVMAHRAESLGTPGPADADPGALLDPLDLLRTAPTGDGPDSSGVAADQFVSESGPGTGDPAQSADEWDFADAIAFGGGATADSYGLDFGEGAPGAGAPGAGASGSDTGNGAESGVAAALDEPAELTQPAPTGDLFAWPAGHDLDVPGGPGAEEPGADEPGAAGG